MAVARQTLHKMVSEVRNVAVDFSGLLDADELLTGTPTVAEITTTALTLTDKAVSTSVLRINGKERAAGEAVTFKVAGGVAGTTYKIGINCGTTATPAQTLRGVVTLVVDADDGT